MAITSKKLQRVIFDIMSDGGLHDLSDIKEQIQQRNGWSYKADYTEGQFSSTMRRFRLDGTLEQLERGSYRMNPDVLEQHKSKQAHEMEQEKEKKQTQEEEQIHESEENESATVHQTDEDFFSASQRVLHILKEQYMYLSKQMKGRTVDSLNEKDIEMTKIIWKLKNELERILKENHILTEDLNP